MCIYANYFFTAILTAELFEANRFQPVEIEYFSDHVKIMHENRDRIFEHEYQVSADVHFQGWKGSAWGILFKIIYHHYTNCTNLTLYL